MAYILIVEDDKDLARATQQILELEGYQVTTADNGEEGLSAQRGKLPDLVITDFEMPVVDGVEMVRRMLIEDCGRENIPVIIVSGFPEIDKLAARIGTPYFLAKPYELDIFLKIVGQALRERSPPRRKAA